MRASRWLAVGQAEGFEPDAGTRAADRALCTTAGEIATSGPHEASLVVTALGGDGFSIERAVAPRASGGLRAAGAQAARCAAKVEDRPHRVLLLVVLSVA
jgi:hypothetical protein